jgi:hypothetical protein
MPVIEGAIGAPLQFPAAPGTGTDEVQTVATTGTPTGGTFKLRFQGFTTGDIAYNAAAAAIDTALELLPSVGSGGVACAGGPLPTGVTVTFSGANLAKKAQPLLELAENALTGGTTPTVTIVESTPGVDAGGRGAAKGTQAVDLATGILYINTGTAQAPTWTKVGTQT